MAEVAQNATVTTSGQLYTTRQVNSTASTDIDFHETIQLYDEMIEIPEGYGITLNGYRSASNNVYAYGNIKFIEIDATETI